MADAYWHVTKAVHSDLPNAIMSLHAREGRFVGACDVTCGTGFVPRFLLRLAGFPKAGSGVPVSLVTQHLGETTIWLRDFGGHKTRSTIRTAQSTTEVAESFGPFTIQMKPQPANGTISLPVSGFRILGLPMPRALWPRSETTESEGADGRYHFDVAGYLPFFGLLIRYKGSLTRDN